MKALPGTVTWRVTWLPSRDAAGAGQRGGEGHRAAVASAFAALLTRSAEDLALPMTFSLARFLPTLRPTFIMMPILPWPRSLP